jgi:hypothetical protein
MESPPFRPKKLGYLIASVQNAFRRLLEWVYAIRLLFCPRNVVKRRAKFFTAADLFGLVSPAAKAPARAGSALQLPEGPHLENCPAFPTACTP